LRTAVPFTESVGDGVPFTVITRITQIMLA
jgi:hypothetical protein